MPRCARVKSETAMYHIISRSISEVDLFRSEQDKEKYLTILKEYQKLYNYKIYAYCLMDTHVHIIIDSNGADISKIMHGVNFKYAMYFNKAYNRHGHLFQDRFKSKIIDNQRYLITVAAYIHNNPENIPGYQQSPQNYKFSSLGIYAGVGNNLYDLIEEGFLLHFFGNNITDSREKYLNSVLKSNIDRDEKEVGLIEDKTEYRSGIRLINRRFNPSIIISFVTQKLKINKETIRIKYYRKSSDAKAVLVVFLRSFSNLKCCEISNIIGDITLSQISKLSSKGLYLINNETKYESMYKEFLNCNF